ncbi:MAG TPA: hypothetical protein VF701_18550 [Thermoanaerobaculia bacterium]
MTLRDSDDPRAVFDYFSAEYAQALQAFQTIENQAPTLLLLGCSDDLRQFLEQFLEMASRTRALAATENETNFVEWFDELIARAESLKASTQRS